MLWYTSTPPQNKHSQKGITMHWRSAGIYSSGWVKPSVEFKGISSKYNPQYIEGSS